MDAEVETAEADQRHDGDHRRRHRRGSQSSPSARPVQERECAVDGDRDHRVPARERVRVEVDERDLRPRAVEGQLERDVQHLSAHKHEGQEQRVGRGGAPVEDDAHDEREACGHGGAAEIRDRAERIDSDARAAVGEPVRERNVPPGQRIVREVVLGDAPEGDRRGRRRGERDEERSVTSPDVAKPHDDPGRPTAPRVRRRVHAFPVPRWARKRHTRPRLTNRRSSIH